MENSHFQWLRDLDDRTCIHPSNGKYSLSLEFLSFAIYIISSNVLPPHFSIAIQPITELKIDIEAACAHINNYYNYKGKFSIMSLGV